MTTEPRRRMTLSDILVLVAATATGLALWRMSYVAYIGNPEIVNARVLVTQGIIFTLPQLACWSAAVLILALRRPRPDLRRMIRRPGIATLAAVAFEMILHGAKTCAEATVLFWLQTPPNLFVMWTSQLNVHVAEAILAVWLVMACSGRWRRSRTWVERVGLAVGSGWIVVYLAYASRIYY